MRVWLRFLLCSACIAFPLILPPNALYAQSYRYIDEAGNIFFVDSIDQVPRRYRDQVIKPTPVPVLDKKTQRTLEREQAKKKREQEKAQAKKKKQEEREKKKNDQKKKKVSSKKGFETLDESSTQDKDKAAATKNNNPSELQDSEEK